jgi:hypothetical protein
MEHIFLASRDYLDIEHAMRRAELLGLGADAQLVSAVLAARPAVDLHQGEFWRTAWHFLIASAREIHNEQIAPLIDFLHAVRHEHVAIDTADGVGSVQHPPAGGHDHARPASGSRYRVRVSTRSGIPLLHAKRQ